MSTLSDLPNLTFYGDSSSRDKDYMVSGGFVVAGNRIAEVESHIAQLRAEGGIQSEFHWASYRGGKRRAAYEALVDYAFSLVAKRHAAFFVLVARFAGYNHKAKANENADTSVNRMYYQIALHRLGKFYGSKRAIHMRLDEGNDCADICAMRNEVCADIYKTYKTRPNCIRSIEAVKSVNSGAVQMADVLIGAIAAKANRIVHTSPKGELADYVQAVSGHPSWLTGTARDAKFFNVWQFKGK